MSSGVKNFAVFGGLAIVAILGYYLFVIKDSSTISAGDVVASQADAETREFLQRLQDLRTVDLDTDVLRDPRFKTLVDFSTDIVTVPVGRANPFEPAN